MLIHSSCRVQATSRPRLLLFPPITPNRIVQVKYEGDENHPFSTTPATPTPATAITLGPASTPLASAVTVKTEQTSEPTATSIAASSPAPAATPINGVIHAAPAAPEPAAAMPVPTEGAAAMEVDSVGGGGAAGGNGGVTATSSRDEQDRLEGAGGVVGGDGSEVAAVSGTECGGDEGEGRGEGGNVGGSGNDGSDGAASTSVGTVGGSVKRGEADVVGGDIVMVGGNQDATANVESVGNGVKNDVNDHVNNHNNNHNNGNGNGNGVMEEETDDEDEVDDEGFVKKTTQTAASLIRGSNLGHRPEPMPLRPTSIHPAFAGRRTLPRHESPASGRSYGLWDPEAVHPCFFGHLRHGGEAAGAAGLAGWSGAGDGGAIDRALRVLRGLTEERESANGRELGGACGLGGRVPEEGGRESMSERGREVRHVSV